MAQIPNAKNYQPLNTDDEQIIRVWLENQTERLVNRLNEMRERLQAGETVSFQPIDLKDGKFKAVMWEKHHGKLVAELVEKGWYARSQVNLDTKVSYIAIASVKK